MHELTNPQQLEATDRTAVRSGGGPGTESSNTVPLTSISDYSTSVLRTGIDSLYLSYPGSLNPVMAAKLAKLKELAQSRFSCESELAQLPLGEQLMEVRGNGRHPYAYVLDDGWFHIELAKLGAQRLPMAYCRIASSLLTSMGYESAVAVLDHVVAQFGVTEGQPNVSRVDVCVDFVTDYSLDQLSESEFVSKARSFSRHMVSRQFSGMSFSAGSPTSARLYNKTLEIQSKQRPRPELELLWKSKGWNGAQDVWRLEFQLRRESLAAFDLVPYAKMANSLYPLWHYCTQQWLRHTVPSTTDKTQSRWPTTSFWQTLQSAVWDGDEDTRLSRNYPDRGRPPCDRSLYINGLSVLTSFAAREGYIDAGEAAQAYLEAAKHFHDQRAMRSVFSGREDGINVDFEEYFREKVNAKRRAYNTGKNEPIQAGEHPGAAAAAEAYRLAKDGE